VDTCHVAVCDVSTRREFELTPEDAARWAELGNAEALGWEFPDTDTPGPYDEWANEAEALYDGGSAQMMPWRELHSTAILKSSYRIPPARRSVSPCRTRRGTTRAVRPSRRRASRSRAPTSGDSEPPRPSAQVGRAAV
jgi:hypothetical protein